VDGRCHCRWRLVAVVIVIVLVLVGALLASPFGIFFSRGSGGDGAQEIFLPQVVQQLSQEHHERIEEVQQNNEHDELVFEGNAVIDWPHLHFEVIRNGGRVDPMIYFQRAS